MTTLDIYILDAVKVVGGIALVIIAIALALGAALAVSVIAWRIYRNALGWPLARKAIAEYRKTHPEEFVKFDATKGEAAHD